MGTVQATPEKLFEIIQDLLAQRAQAEEIRTAGGVPAAGVLSVWETRTLDLIGQALEEDHYDYGAFVSARGGQRIIPPMASRAQAESIRIWNLQQHLDPHIPPLDDAIKEAEKKLKRLTGGVLPSGPVSTPLNAVPSVDFSFVKDPRLRKIAERDYSELRVAAYYQSDKSKALLAGSVVEATVLDLLLQKGIAFDELKKMSAHALYERAKAEGLLQGKHLSAADASRDGRNFVHPAVEYREGELTREQADLAISLMRAILRELGAT